MPIGDVSDFDMQPCTVRDRGTGWRLGDTRLSDVARARAVPGREGGLGGGARSTHDRQPEMSVPISR